MQNSISVLYVEDDELVRLGLCMLIRTLPAINVVGTAKNGQEALLMMEQLKADVLVADICMPVMDGITLTRFVRQRFPDVAVVILTGWDDDTKLNTALCAGATAYVLKGSGIAELEIAIRSAVKGDPYLTPPMAKQLLAERFINTTPKRTNGIQLTVRQRQTLKLIAEGKTNKEIAVSLNVTTKTVEKHRTDLMKRLSVSNAPDLIRYALSHDLV